MVYVYDESMEISYENSLLKAFAKQVGTRHFSLLIVDAPNVKMNSVNRLAAIARDNQYAVFLIETTEKDPRVCYKRNIHDRTFKDIEKVKFLIS